MGITRLSRTGNRPSRGRFRSPGVGIGWRSRGKDTRMSSSSGTGACRLTTGKRSGRSWPVTGRLTLGDVIGVLHPLRGGGGISAREPIGSVPADSREITPGGRFGALPGERVDGADYVEEAIRKGARAAIVSEEGARKVPHEILAGKPVFVVRNSVEALGDLARAHRERLRHIPLVGITGSSGKTSTKEMLAALLFRSRKVLRNPGNRQNLIGLPFDLLDFPGDPAVAGVGHVRTV